MIHVFFSPVFQKIAYFLGQEKRKVGGATDKPFRLILFIQWLTWSVIEKSWGDKAQFLWKGIKYKASGGWGFLLLHFNTEAVWRLCGS